MPEERRKVTYRLYPKPKQLEDLERHRALHQQLYNAMLQQRIEAYRRRHETVGFAAQCRDITVLRHEIVEYGVLNAQSMQVTAKRLDLAFKAFFRRVRDGAARAGFPRFKSLKRYSGWGYKNHGDGWRLVQGEGGKHGALRLSGIGLVQVRGKARDEGEPKTCEILHKNGRWYVSVTFACEPKRESTGTQAVALDWGVETFATLATADGRTKAIENPRNLERSRYDLELAQRELSRKKRGSNNRRKAARRVGRIHERIAKRRRDFLHKQSAMLVAFACAIVTEELAVKNMTGSAKGTVEVPGKMVKQKAGLNRSILDTAPAAFLQMLRCKAGDAGIAYVEVSTKKHAPSQTCHACGRRAKKTLAERVHRCECGAACGRDENAARVLVGLWGREPALCGGAPLGTPEKQETPAVAA